MSDGLPGQPVDPELRDALRALFGFEHSRHCPMTHHETGAKIVCVSCRKVEIWEELLKAQRIIEWYEAKHQQRRAQVYEAQEDARRMQEKERDTFGGLQDCADEVDKLRKALKPFANVEECGHGMMIDGRDGEHDCPETRDVLRARKALLP